MGDKEDYHLLPDELWFQLVPLDLKRLGKNVRLATEKKEQFHLRVQSIVGHASKGHGVFMQHGRHGLTSKASAIYSNTDVYEVIKAIGVATAKKRPAEAYLERKLRERQNVVSDIQAWLMNAAQGQHTAQQHFLVRQGKPLAGVSDFRKDELTVLHPLDVARGYLAGVAMDNFEARRHVQEKFGLEMGGGAIYAVDLPAMRATGLTLEKLAAIPFQDNVPGLQLTESIWDLEEGDGIEWLRQEGIIFTPRRRSFQVTEEQRPEYVRLVSGLGVSDDAAVVMASFLYGQDFAKGVFLADAIDTWDKATPLGYVGGQDEEIAKFIATELRRHTQRQMLSKEEVTDFIYLAAIDPPRHTHYPDCSQRRFLEKIRIDTPRGKNGVSYPFKEHLRFSSWLRQYVMPDGEFDAVKASNDLKKTYIPNVDIGFEQRNLRDFYQQIILRLQRFQREHGPLRVEYLSYKTREDGELERVIDDAKPTSFRPSGR